MLGVYLKILVGSLDFTQDTKVGVGGKLLGILGCWGEYIR